MDRTADPQRVDAALARVHREEWARIVAGLARRFGDLDIAEDAAAEAFSIAVERWTEQGVPPNPGAWLTTTAVRTAIDRLRREARRDDKHREAAALLGDVPAEPVGAVEDDRLRLVFVCCHPGLPPEARVALTLRIVGGLTVAEIAHAFLVRETTMGQRISRAKAKIRADGIPFRLPERHDLPERTAGVLAVLYLIFNEGYLASGDRGDALRPELTGEAIRLTRLMRSLCADGSAERAEATGLLALMLFTESRAASRVSSGGELVRLDEQDRGAWDHALIAEGRALADEALRPPAGRYALLAAISGEHAAAPHPRDTDWAAIVSLYDRLERIDPSPVVALNRAIAVSEYDSPDVGLALVERLGDAVDGHHAFHATRGELLRLVGRSAEARSAYDRAISLAGSRAEIAHLTRRREQLAAPPPNGARS